MIVLIFSFLFLFISFSTEAALKDLKYNSISFQPLLIDGYKLNSKYENMRIQFSMGKETPDICKGTGTIINHFRDKLVYILQDNQEENSNCLVPHLLKREVDSSELIGVESQGEYDRIAVLKECAGIISNKYVPKKNYFELRKTEELLKKHPGSLLLRLARISLYQQLGNSVRANSILKSIIRQESFSTLFDINSLILVKENSRVEFIKSFVTVVNYIVKNISDAYWRPIFVESLTDMITIDELKPLRDKYIIDWSLQDIKSISRTQKYGYSICSFWYFKLKRREGLTNSDEYLDNCLSKEILQTMPTDNLWILLYFTASDSEKRKIISKRIREISSSKRSYITFIKMRMLRNDVLYGILKSVSNSSKEPIFRQEREFYKGLFKAREALPLATYHLLKLGERGEELLLWPRVQKR